MKLNNYGSDRIEVVLSRSNLESLLEYLDDRYDEVAAISRTCSGVSVMVTAEEDVVHYKDRPSAAAYYADQRNLRARGTPDE